MGIPTSSSRAHLLPSAPPPFAITTITAFLLFALVAISAHTVSADLYTLIYKGCATGGGGQVPQQSLSALSTALLAKSSTSKFFKTTTGGDTTPLFGLYQCRGDLSPGDCSACVARLPSLWVSLCGQAAAARVHLAGCYGLYQLPGFPQVSGTKMLYKTCSTTGSGGGGFEEMRGTALTSLQSGVAGSGAGFYATSYGNVYAMAQCEGDLSAGDCGECVAEAAQKVQVECGGAASGQMYLDKCYVSYSYYSHGVPRDAGNGVAGAVTSSSGGGGGNGGGGSGGSGQPTSKTVAIVVGGAAGVGFLVICLLFVRSLYKKRDDY